MKFHNYVSQYEMFKAAPDTRESASGLGWRKTLECVVQSGGTMGNAAKAELAWYEHCQPYYKIWPAIIPSLLRIPLEVTADSISLPLPAISMRVADCGESLRAVLVYYEQRDDIPVNGARDMTMLIQTASYKRIFVGLSLRPGSTVEDSLKRAGWFYSTGTNDNEANECAKRAIRLSVAVSLMAVDPSIIKPEVLNVDKDKFDATNDDKYIAKAKRRGVVGWNIGEDIESMPHFRRPHFALRHTGKGGAIPKIVPVKAAVVHRSKMTQVPTGYVLPDGTEVEKP